MFGRDGFFKARNKGTEIVGLNLESSAPASVAPQTQLPVSELPSLQELNTIPAEAQVEVNNLVRQLLDTGVNVTHLSYIGDPKADTKLTLPENSVSKRPILLFSSPLLALDYIRAHRINAFAIQFKIEDLPASAEGWLTAGIDSFVFNCCPRCSARNVLKPGNGVITPDQIRLAWVTWRVLRQRSGQRCLNAFLSAKSDVARQRTTLEYVRDHVDYANPYVHWLIALFAGMQADEPARLGSTARLEEFGPAFKGRTTPMTEPGDMTAWGSLTTKAMLGYVNSYKMLAANPAIPSNSSVIGIPDPPP